MATYFPYLRAKTYELSAVEHASAALVSNGKILPILEPVRVASGPIVRRAAAFGAAGLTTALVLNPQVGELYGNPSATTQILAAMQAAGATVLPALLVHARLQVAEVQAFQGAAAGGGVVVHLDVPAPPVVAAVKAITTATNLFLDGATSVAHQNSFAPRSLLRDGFSAQVRNSSYPATSFFTDLHLTYTTLGFAGFGDFATIGARYTEGGGPAYAVAIHVTEDRQAQGVYCNHFLSTSNATTANPGGKFGEAVAALAAYVQANPGRIDFSLACQELLRHHRHGHFPGLGDLKRLSIQHHLELMARLV
jgi:hypothetical protein